MNKITCLSVLFALFLISCGKNDKPEYVDDKPVTNKPLDKNDRVKDSTGNKNIEKPENPDKSGNNKKDDSKNLNEKSFNKDEKPVAVITPLEANDYLGKTVTIKGFVADIYKSEKVAYLNFVEKYPENPFTGVIFSDKFSDFSNINKYKGKNVEVTGRVSMFNKKPQIILNSESQIKIVN